MPRDKRLHFKDLDALRFLAFVPIFIYCFLKLLTFDKEGITFEIARAVEYIAKNSVDFFFFLSAFLLTSHILREYKYRKEFSFKNYIVRRFLRLISVLVVALLFVFLLHPWLIQTLKLQPIVTPDGWSYVLLLPNYFYNVAVEQYVYLIVVWAIFMFIQFYFIWGLLLYFAWKYLKYICFLFMGIGITARIIHLSTDTLWEFDTLSYGIAIGIGGLSAMVVRREHWIVERIKKLSKKVISLGYVVGAGVMIFAYYLAYDGLATAFVPFFNCAFFTFLVLEQTFAKSSLFKLRRNKLFTHLGKISYGMIVYQAIMNVLVMTAISSLDFDLRSDVVKIFFFVISFALSWVLADVSFNLLEKPLLIFRKEFKKI
jgi:peptidoglycan/LPS O-acetylase OafA/YrhL